MATCTLVAQQPPDGDRVADPHRLSRGAAIALVVGSLFLQHCVNGLYEGLERPVPEAWPVLSSVGLAMSVTAWFWEYSRSQRIVWVLDMGWFLLGAWIIIVPYYILKREDKRGLGRIGLFCLTYFGAWASGVAIRTWVRILTLG